MGEPINVDSSSWSGYVNNWDETFVFECSSGAGVVAGLESEHDNHTEDRRWSFKCVVDSGTCYHDCHFTPFLNDYDDPHGPHRGGWLCDHWGGVRAQRQTGGQEVEASTLPAQGLLSWQGAWHLDLITDDEI